MSNIYSLKRDDDFDGLDQLSALYKETRAGIKPPPELDIQIRAAARDALKPRKSITPRWAGGFAIAATLVLSIGLVTLVQQEVPDASRDAPVAESAEPEPASPIATGALAPASTQSPQVSQSFSATDQQNVSRGVQLQQIKGLSQQAKARQAMQDTGLTNEVAATAATRGSVTVAEENKPLREAKAWLDDIIELQKTDNKTEFKKQLAAFKKAYPDYPLPPSLSSR